MKTRLLLTAAVVMSALCTRAADFVSGNFCYDIVEFVGQSGKEAVVTGLADGYVPQGELAFPREIEYEGTVVPVVALGWANHVGHEGDEPVVCACDGITSVRIPRYMRYIGRIEFKDCPNIQKYIVEEGSETYTTVGNALIERNDYSGEERFELIRYPSAATASTYTVPASVGYVAFGAFAANRYLKKLYLIGSQWLRTGWQYDNKSITAVDCSNSNQYRTGDDGAVYYGSSLKALCPGRHYTTFTVPERCGDISAGAFCFSSVDRIVIHPDVFDVAPEYGYMGSDVREVVIEGESPWIIGECAFMDCRNLESMSIGTSSTNNTIVATCAFLNCEALKTVQLAEATRSINLSSRVFEGCKSLEAFPLTSKMKIKTLRTRAFAGCESLTSFLFGSVDEFENQEGFQFAGSGLRQVHWPTGVVDVPRGCFAGCRSLEKVYLKSTTEDIYEDAFRGSGLLAVNMMGVEWYSRSAFKDCESLMRLYFPNSGKRMWYSPVDFKAPSPQVIVDNPAIAYLDEQSEYPGKASLYVSMVDGCKLGTGWRTVYVPGRAGDLYRQLSGTEVVEMYSYDTYPEESAVSVRPAVEGVKIISVVIEGEEAIYSDGKYRITGSVSEPEMMNVKIRYTVYGNEMNSSYNMTYTSAADAQEDIPVDESAEWYTATGLKVAEADLRPGVYIRRRGAEVRKILVK